MGGRLFHRDSHGPVKPVYILRKGAFQKYLRGRGYQRRKRVEVVDRLRREDAAGRYVYDGYTNGESARPAQPRVARVPSRDKRQNRESAFSHAAVLMVSSSRHPLFRHMDRQAAARERICHCIAYDPARVHTPEGGRTSILGPGDEYASMGIKQRRQKQTPSEEAEANWREIAAHPARGMIRAATRIFRIILGTLDRPPRNDIR